MPTPRSLRAPQWAIGAALGAVSALSATTNADIVMAGNTMGNPVKASKDPCPVHGGRFNCQSELVPQSVTLIEEPTQWFKDTLTGSYSDDEWNFWFAGGNDNLKGKFDVAFYKAYNDCGGVSNLLGAEISVNFVPDADSPIQDVLWASAYRETWPNHDASRMDVKAWDGRVMGAPFYPYQDEDESADRWQSGYGYDEFYDKPGDPCPDPHTTTSLRFETYAVWWDDYFDANGGIVDVGNDGHHVFVHEGYSWGYDLTCVPAPGALVLLMLGSLTAYPRRRFRPGSSRPRSGEVPSTALGR